MKFRALTVFTAAVTALFGLVVAGPATAAPPPQLSLFTSNITVHTSNGKAWSFSISIFQLNQNDDLGLNLSRQTTGGTEGHFWSVPTASSTLTFNKATGKGVLKTPNATSPLTTLNMVFKVTSHSAVHCASGSETDYAGTLSGQATLVTHLKGGGTVGGRHVSFKAGTTHLFADNGCVPSFQPSNRCSKSVSFEASDSHQHSLFGFAAGTARFIEISHNVAIAHPAGSTRSDTASARPSSAPALNKTTKTLKVFGSTSGSVTGSGRIVAHGLSHSSRTCKLDGKNHTEVQYLSSNGHLTNTSGHPLVGHTILTGRITMANGGTASFDYETWH